MFAGHEQNVWNCMILYGPHIYFDDLLRCVWVDKLFYQQHALSTSKTNKVQFMKAIEA